MDKLEKLTIQKIQSYETKGSLKTLALLFLDQAELEHRQVKEHSMRVALLMEATAIKLEKDSKAAFYGGLLHDNGKITLSSLLFDGHDISSEEYDCVKKHAIYGHKTIEKQCLFTALMSGLHHNTYKHGYGLDINCLPKDWCPATIAKLLNLSIMLSICDYIDADTYRKTKIKNEINQEKSLKEILYEKFPEEHQIINVVLKENEKLFKKLKTNENK